MNERTGFFEESPNNKSIGRLLVFVLSVVGILFSGATLAVGLVKYLQPGSTETLTTIAAATGGLLVSVTGTAMTFKHFSKTQETKQ